VALKVLSLNLWHDAGPWPARAKRIREWIDRLDPDLVGFQEALEGDGVDLAAELMAGRGYHLDFAAATPRWLGRDVAFGNAVASRWPIAERAVLALPGGGDGETRSALSVTVEAPCGPIAFTCTHLNWRFHHGHVRERQVLALAEWARARRPKDGFPPVMVGDFNAAPESAEIRFLSGLQSLAGRSVYWNDAFAVAGDGGPGLTWSNRNDHAREWLEPDRRIDYVFVGPPRRDGVGQVTDCRVVCDDVVDGVWPSDHFGVLAELRDVPIPELAGRA
jgi:endonuclease/exonuclease/phosphatase family metal-dependent hydrolase